MTTWRWLKAQLWPLRVRLLEYQPLWLDGPNRMSRCPHTVTYVCSSSSSSSYCCCSTQCLRKKNSATVIFLNNSVKYWPIVDNFGVQHHNDVNDCSFGHLILILLLHSTSWNAEWICTLAVCNDKVILGSALKKNRIIKFSYLFGIIGKLVFILRSNVDILKRHINSEPRDYWTCRWRVVSASTRLRSCWRQTFWARERWCDVTHVTFDAFFERQ